MAITAASSVIAVATEGDTGIRRYSDHVVYVPDTHESLQPLLSVVPLQLLAYHAAVARGCNVDKPRNLAKSVTVEYTYGRRDCRRTACHPVG